MTPRTLVLVFSLQCFWILGVDAQCDFDGPYKTCSDIQENDPESAKSNKAYELEVDNKITQVFCHMTTINECGAGAWTLAMKIDGSKNTFNYNSNYWKDKNAYNKNGGLTGFDKQETKLPTYWSTPFTRICLGMKVGNEMKFLPIDIQASSLHSLIADGKHRSTYLGRNAWKSLASGSSLQHRCNREGFNAFGANGDRFSKARIGIIGNNENDCKTTDSRIGFGTGGYPDDTNTCGYIARHGGDKGNKDAKAMGYIFVGSPKTYKTCQEIRQAAPQMANSNRPYLLETYSGNVPVYCHMTTLNGCGSAAWTLVMKIDGKKNTFNYNSNYWKDQNTYNENGGLTGFDNQETKLSTYWSTPFAIICLGMKVGNEMKFLPIFKQASSLHSLIADGKHRSTSLGRNAWKSLASGSSLQPRCNREGFNAFGANGDRFSKARIGIIGNNENDCKTTDSRIGFGTGGYPDDTNTCGYIARHGGDKGDKDAKAMGYIFVGSPKVYKTCQEVRQAAPQMAHSNGPYLLKTYSGNVPVYCHMTTPNGCGSAAWTLVMKIDGKKNTFNYNSNYWKDKKTYNENGGLTGFDNQETKLSTYWSTPFTMICLGMKVGNEMKFLPIFKQAPSLHSLIADGKHRSTSLGRNAWKSLASGSSLQPRCNREGFNAFGANGDRFSKARIGIIGNNENDCKTTDSRIGFGTGGYPDDTNTCGYIARHGGDNGNKDVKAMGYIFVGSPKVYKTCKELRRAEPQMANSNRAHLLKTSSGDVPVYCHMTTLNGCGSGGWTLVMKINGKKSTFNYDSSYWKNKNAFNMNAGISGLDDQETKLPTYWSTSFSKICLGMKVGGQTRFILLNQGASSLYSLIADGKYRPTSLNRKTWKSLVPNSSLQHKCGRQGFNAVSDKKSSSKARIGITNNNENDCRSNDSRLGFGTGGYPDNNQACGNVAKHGGDIGDRNIPAMGYIFVM